MRSSILYIHSPIWHQFFSDLLKYYQENFGLKVIIICDSLTKQLYNQNFARGADYIVMPDLEEDTDKKYDHIKLKQIRTIVKECENAAGKSLGRIILTGERTIGRAFSRGFYYWPQSNVHKVYLKDNTKPELSILKSFNFCKSVFDQYKPALVISRSNSDPLAFIMWLLSKRYGVPFVTCRFSKVISKRAFWTDDFHMYNVTAVERFKKKVKASEYVSPFAKEYIHSFREQPQTVDYILQNWRKAALQNWISVHKNMLALLKAKILFYLKGGEGKRPKAVFPKIMEFYRIQIMKRIHKNYFRMFSSDELQKFTYIYYPLHKEPELMLNFESPLWHDQKHAIKFFSSMLPSGCKLLVREHRFNWGRRYPDYLEYLSKLPGVILIHPFDFQFKYIKNANIILTDNGSTGWEGVLLQKPVITLEKTFYDGVGLTRKVMAPTSLDRVFLNVLENPMPCSADEYDRLLGLFIDAEHETTLDIEEMHRKPQLSIECIEFLTQRHGVQ